MFPTEQEPFKKPLSFSRFYLHLNNLIYQHEFVSFGSDGIIHCRNATQQAVGRQPEDPGPEVT